MEQNLIKMPEQNALAFRDNFNFDGNVEDAEIIEDSDPNRHFLTANSNPITMENLTGDCIVPVFCKDNEVLISHQQFVQATYQACKDYYRGEKVNFPLMRVSHPIKGRIPEAIHKKASELIPTDKTLYYERMAFAIDIPTIMDEINGNRLNLSVVGVKSYGRDNISGKLTMQSFSLAVGFVNQVCTNLCIFGENYREDIQALDSTEIYSQCLTMLSHYDMSKHLYLMNSLTDVTLTETQFALILGRMRMYNYLPSNMKREIPRMLINDNAVNNVAKQFYKDKNFRADNDGKISMWKFFNLCTGAVKNSYIDVWLGREKSAMDTSLGITSAIKGENQSFSWFIQ